MRKCLVIRKDERGVSPVIATILMVAITVVLAAVLYVMVTGLLAGPGATKPQVTFGQGHPTTTPQNGFEFEVGGATLQRPAASYRVNLLVNGSASTTGAKTLTTSAMTFTSGETPARVYTVTWADIGGEGDLTGGDLIKVYGPAPSGIHALTDFTVIFLWTDGSSVGSRTYP